MPKIKGPKTTQTQRGFAEGSFVPTHEDGNPLSCNYLHQMEAAIKARTILAGSGINITQAEGGTTVALAGNVLEFNVCSNGNPGKVFLIAVA